MFKIRKIYCIWLVKYKLFYFVYMFSNFIGDFMFMFIFVKKSVKEILNIYFNEKKK